MTGTIADAGTVAGSCGGGASGERVFQWTPIANGTMTVETCSTTGTTADTVLYMRQGDCAGGELACNDDTQGCGIVGDGATPRRGSRITRSVTAGQTYTIVVDGYSGGGTFSLTLFPPDACNGPTTIPPAGGTFTGTSTAASTQAGSCGGGSAPETVYQWTPSTSGVASIDTCNTTSTTFDTVVYLRQGTCGTGTELACNDDTQGCGVVGDGANPRRGSRITPTVTAGQTYFIVVDGYTSGGSFSLNVAPPP